MIDIVFITDNNYVFPTKIAIKSLIKNRDINNNYRINIIGVDLTQENIDILNSLTTNNLEINIIQETNKYKDIGLDHLYVSKAALFKFQIPNIFPDLDKILYLDGDILIEKDLSELFNINLEDKYAGVVKDYMAQDILNYHLDINLKNYFNSGVMLLNLKQMRKYDMANKLLIYKKNNNLKRCMDQDTLNACFLDNVIYLSPKYNLMLSNLNYDNDDIAKFYDITTKEYFNILNKPTIIHLTNKKKPWNSLTAIKSREFWSYADNFDILQMSEKIAKIQIAESKKIYPKFLINIICFFIFNKKKRHNFRKKYIKEK